MTFSEIQKHYKQIQDAVLGKRLHDAFQILNKTCSQIHSSDIQNRYRSLEDTYQNMLKYSFGITSDPERNTIYNKLRQSMLELSDDIREQWIRDMNLFDRKEMLNTIMHFEARFLTDPQTVPAVLEQKKVSPGASVTHAQYISQLFYSFYLKREWNEETCNLLTSICHSRETAPSIKAQLISACTLSLLRHFDRNNFILHYELAGYELPEVRQRALVGLFLAILQYQQRLPLYSSLTNRLGMISDNTKFQERLLAIMIQFIRASETEKITRKIQDEIVPEVLKMKNELQDKLNLDELLNQENFEEKNPDWQNFFKDAPDVYQKLEQFSQMQIEGADVFMGAFAMLKHFPFFKEMANWFIPFQAGHEAVIKAFDGISEGIDVPAFTEGLEQSTVLCNSDKYSFCLNMMQMPSEQRKMMLELFNMELKAMNEMMDDEFRMNAESKSKIIHTQYIQDLYRFFKINPLRKEFPGLFDTEIDLLDSSMLSLLFKDRHSVKNLAEFYFARDRYPEALKLFTWLNSQESSFELLEKMGFCAQKLNDYPLAIELYKQAELFDQHKVWLQKKLGYCYRKTGHFQTAIEYYNHIIKAEPKDLTNLAYLGQLHMDIEDFEEALRYYYQVEYQNPSNPKVYRPIGWCSFVLGRHETAIKYFNKVLMGKPGKSDYLNLGHAYWVSGKLPECLDAYRNALRTSGYDSQWFRDTFMLDSTYLLRSGFEELDLMLMVDYVLLG